MDEAPYLVTLALDECSQRAFDDLRRRYFPPERLLVGAHLTLFHRLPAQPCVLEDCADAARRPRFVVRSTGLRNLGGGVAIDLIAPELQAIHRDLAARWRSWLTPQDRQPFRPHVTIENKVAPEVARRTERELAGDFVAGEHTALGLEVWRYRGGPWEHVRLVPFDATS